MRAKKEHVSTVLDMIEISKRRFSIFTVSMLLRSKETFPSQWMKAKKRYFMDLGCLRSKGITLKKVHLKDKRIFRNGKPGMILAPCQIWIRKELPRCTSSR
jgi:hypothetical protein